MVKKMQILSGRHICNREMDMRIVDVKEDENSKNNEILSWIIYGICKKCKVVVMLYLFMQSDEPINGIDYTIDYNKVVNDTGEVIK